ncbi:MAG: helix-turn-helix transcriptional regulator [Solirubrobacteraceae bacterium]
MSEYSVYFRPAELPGVEALHTARMGRGRRCAPASRPLASLASFAGLTRFELVRRFRQQAGLTPHAFQTNLRVARARAMLIAGDPIAWVAAACGFADQSHLTRTFRRMVGVTPGRFASA